MGMLDKARLAQMQAGQKAWSSGSSVLQTIEPFEGSFQFQNLTIGLVLAPQPEHWARYGDQKLRKLPLLPGHGWVFAGGVDGHCQWKAPQTFINVSIDSSVFHNAGLDLPGERVNRFGLSDPMTAELVLNLHAASDDAPRIYRESLTTALAAHVARLDAEPPPQQRGDQRVARALAYLEDHLSEDVALETLASTAAMSPFHFTRVFKAQTGLPPHRYVIHRRMERAKDLLKSQKRSVMDIAWTVGYQDVSRFGELFKRHTGMTPAAYRSA
jgi:AraC family transcriptional regulator